MLVLDEADEILSKGFENTLQEIFSYINIGLTQNLLYSATLSIKVLSLTKMSLKNPLKILLNSD